MFAAGLSLGFVSPETASGAERLSYNRDIRPILSQNCFACHGPDATTRKAGLRLDDPATAQARLKSGVRGIVPGDAKASALVARIFHADADERMPPAESHKTLSAAQKATLRDWIEQGAEYETHWSFIPPKRAALPTTKRRDWARNAIDAFVLARLEAQGMSPAPEADRATLARRLHLDLTGLPPTPAQVDAFVSDTSADAYEKLVDRLLASPHFGERLALPWLDAARYADTNGFSIDDHRDMWAWREWVIDAFNRDMPYDDFVVQQLAGDLLPGATDMQRLATGFLRNSMNTHEGGTIAAEYRVIYIADKIDTVGTAFMGLTLRCAQCHDHKYDPISMKEYYSFYAFFDTAHEPGKGAANANTKPTIAVVPPLTDAETLRRDLQHRIDTLKAFQANVAPKLDRANSHKGTLNREIEVLERDRKAGKTTVMVMKEQGPRQTYVLTRGQYDKPDKTRPVKPNVPAALPPLDANPATPKPVRPAPSAQLWRTARWIWDDPNGATTAQDDAPRYFRYTLVLDAKPKSATLHVSADNRGTAFVNGERLGTSEPWMTPGKYDVTKQLVKGRNVVAIEVVNQGGPAGLLASLIVDGKTEHGSDKRWKVAKALSPKWSATAFDDRKWSAANELGPPSKAPWGLKVGGAPAPVVDPSRPTRLSLARWLVKPGHPLTARVAVNRHWQMLFGRGLVDTPYDFGSQGSFPSHPALLDWLSVDYAESGWRTKRLIKMIVTSATYRQTSAVASDAYERDPHNQWLGRGARYRLPAEFVRDGALKIGGLLSGRVGGPSVYPHQPRNLWLEVSHFGYGNPFTAQAFYPSAGEHLHRRSMYTFWKRTSPPPAMSAFDAPTREVCTAVRSRTNTPLQALILLNDPQFVDAARALALMTLQKGGATDAARLTFAFRRAVQRDPTPRETAILHDILKKAQARFAADRAAAKKLVAGVTVEFDHTLDPADHAAWTTVASVLLNFDETITKE